MSSRSLRSILFACLAGLSAWSQSYQTQFTDVKFDRAKGPGTLHGPVEVEGATGAVYLRFPLGGGLGARGVHFQPVLQGAASPQAWADPPLRISTRLTGLTFHPGALDLQAAGPANTTWTGPSGEVGSLSEKFGDSPFDTLNSQGILTAFGYSGVTVSPAPYKVGSTATPPYLLARGSKGELVIGLAGTGISSHQAHSDELLADYMLPGRVLVVNPAGDVALEYEYTGWKTSSPPFDAEFSYVGSGSYHLSRILNRFADEMRFSYSTLESGLELGYVAQWYVGGALKGSITAERLSGAGTGSSPFDVRVSYRDAGGVTLSTYRFQSEVPAEFWLNPPNGTGVFRVFEHRVKEVWSEDSQEHISLVYGAGPSVSDPTYGLSGQPLVITKVKSTGREINLNWAPYLIRPNTVKNGEPGYRGSLSNKRNWAFGVTSIQDNDTVLNQIRITTHTRVTPVPTIGYSNLWDTTAFYDAVTFPDGQTVLYRYAEPISDGTYPYFILGGVSGYRSDTNSQIQTLAHLKHMVKEVRYYAAGINWTSDLGSASTASTAFKVVVSDRWDLHSAGNPSGLLTKTSVPFPTRSRAFETDTNRFISKEVGNWDAVGFGWRTELSASGITTAPDLSIQWPGQGTSQPSTPSGTQASQTTYKTFESNLALWFLSRAMTEYSVVVDGTGYRDPNVTSPFTSPTTTKSYNTSTNTLNFASVGGVDYTVQTNFRYNGTAPGNLAGSQLSGVTLSGSTLNLTGQVGIESYGYDEYGFMNSIKAMGMSGALGQTQNVLGQALTQIDADGRVIRFQWDAVGRLTRISPPGELPTDYQYHSDNLGVTIVRGAQVTKLRYDGFGQLVLVSRQNLDLTWNHRIFQYDPGGRKIAETVWRPNEGVATDSVAPNLIQDIGNTECVQWKVLTSGEEVCTKTAFVVSEPKLAAGTQWTYDARGRVVQVKDPNGVITTTTYSGLVTARTIAPSTADAATTTFTRDALDRLVRVVDALNQTTNYYYHPNGKIGRVEQMGAATQIRTWSYTSLGWPLQLVQPESGTTSYGSFDVMGRPWITTYGAGSASPRTLTGRFSPLGQLLSLSGSGAGDVSQTFGYGLLNDGKYGSNKLITATANGVTRNLFYDSTTGRLSKLSRVVDNLNWDQTLHYDSYGQLDWRTYPDHSVRTLSAPAGPMQTIGYDNAMGMPNATAFNNGSLASMGYDPTSWMLNEMSYTDGAHASYRYWEDQTRLKTLSMGIPPGQFDKTWTYGYNQRGEVTTDSEDYYSYDKLGRLIAAFVRDPWDGSSGNGPTGIWQQFGYDAFGNRAALRSYAVTNWATGALPPSTPATSSTSRAKFYVMTSGEISAMASTNQLPATIGGIATGAQYDPQGNLTRIYGDQGQTSSQLTMTYDSLARVTTLGDTKNATSQAYLYDDEGLRIKMVDSKTGVTTYSIYNEARQLIATYTKTGTGPLTWKKDIVYVGSKEVAEVSSDGKTYVTLCDHLGTPRYVWSGSGTPVKQKFLPFGEQLTDPTSMGKVAKGFTNHEQTDPSGLIYMQARFYAPMYGRFLSPDPARDQHFEETQSWNIYSYVRNNPVMQIDPTGMLEDKTGGGNPSASNEDSDTLSAGQDAGFMPIHWWDAHKHAPTDKDKKRDNTVGDEAQTTPFLEHLDPGYPFKLLALTAEGKIPEPGATVPVTASTASSGNGGGPSVHVNTSIESFMNLGHTYGNGECYTLGKGLFPGMPQSKSLIQGEAVMGNNNIQIGTAIATFLDGHYPTGSNPKHWALFWGFTDRGFKVFDQIKIKNPITGVKTPQPPGFREIRVKDVFGVNNANSYFTANW